MILNVLKNNTINIVKNVFLFKYYFNTYTKEIYVILIPKCILQLYLRIQGF